MAEGESQSETKKEENKYPGESARKFAKTLGALNNPDDQQNLQHTRDHGLKTIQGAEEE